MGLRSWAMAVAVWRSSILARTRKLLTSDCRRIRKHSRSIRRRAAPTSTFQVLCRSRWLTWTHGALWRTGRCERQVPTSRWRSIHRRRCLPACSARLLRFCCWMRAPVPCGSTCRRVATPTMCLLIRARIYVSCGAGELAVFHRDSSWQALETVRTASGARTSLFVPQLDRLYVAERAGLVGSEAAIRVYRPAP